MKRNLLKSTVILFPVALLLALISQARAGDTYMTDFHTDLDVWLCDGDPDLPVQFLINVDNLPLTSTHLSISANDVAEEEGEFHSVYLNGNYVGHLVGVALDYSTSLFEVPLNWVLPGTNLVRVTVAPGSCIEVDWGQILIDGGEASGADLFDLTVDSYTVASGRVNIQSSTVVSVMTPGNYHVEILAIDPDQQTKASTVDSFSAAASELTTRTITSTYGLDGSTGAYQIMAILFDDTSRKIQAVRTVAFYHDFGTGPVQFDFGDAPDPMYPTTLESNGARHRTGSGLYMGADVDDELDAQTNETASGDDVLDGNDDEDGVTFGVLRQGATAPVTVTVSGQGYLNAWVDFDADGDWADAREQIFVRQGLTTGTHQLSFPVPGRSVTGTVFTRFRFDSGGALSYVGEANDGEVEDHQVYVEEMNLALNKTAADLNGPPLFPGDVILYTVTVINASTADKTNVVVTDTLPPGVTFITASPPGYTGPNPLVWNVGALGPGGAWMANILVQVDGTANPIGGNVAAVSSDQQDAQKTGPIFPPGAGGGGVADGLVLEKTATDLNGEPLYVGDEIRYAITVTNEYTDTMNNVFVTDTLPAGVAFVSATPVTYTGPNPLVWNVGDMISNTVWTAVITVVVDGTADPIGGNVAAVGSDQQNDQISAPVLPPGGGDVELNPGALELAKTAQDLDGAPLQPGDEILYTIYITNALPMTQTNVVITDAIPSGTTYVPGSASSSQGTTSGPDPLVVDVGTLAVGQVVTFSFRVMVNADAMGQTIENFAQADSVQNDPPLEVGPVEPPDGGLVEPSSSALEFRKEAKDLNGLPLYPDDTILYTMYVTNSLSVTQTNVVITDAIPNNVTYILDSALSSQGIITGPDPLVADIGTLAAGQRVTFTFRVMVNGDAVGLRIKNYAQCDSDQQAPPVKVGPIEPAGEVEPIVLTANLAITKDYERPPGLGIITYTVVVYNFGPNSAHGAIMHDAIGSQIHNVSWTCEASLGTSCPDSGTANTLDVMLYSFPPNGVVTFTIAGELDLLADDSNIATITPPQGVGDPDLRDNTAIVGYPYRILLSMVTRNAAPSTVIFPRRDW